MSTRKFKTWLMRVGVVLILQPSMAGAQDFEFAPQNIATTSTCSTFALVGVLVYPFTAIFIEENHIGERLVSSTSPFMLTTTRGITRELKGKGRLLVAYIKNNRVALHQNIALGGGEALIDVARLLDVPQREHVGFARAVRLSRVDLHPLLEDDARVSELGVALDAIATQVTLAGQSSRPETGVHTAK